MKRFYPVLLFLVACWLALPLQANPLRVHPANFYLLQDGRELFYPVGVNASHLLRESVSPSERETQIETWKASGVNTLRLVLDHAIDEAEPLDRLQNEAGRIRDEVLERVDAIVDLAEARNMWVVLALFDLQRAAETWPQSHYHESMGGPCDEFADLYASGTMQEHSVARVGQVVTRYQGRNIAAFELARGINAWEMYIQGDTEIRLQARLWSTLVADQVQDSNREGHLTALSFLPNTLDLTQIRLTDIVFASFRSGDDDSLFQSVPRFLGYALEYTKPVYISEFLWTGDETRRDSVVSGLYWQSVCKMSSLFLSPDPGQSRLSGFDLTVAENASRFLPLLEVDGTPRLPSQAPIQVAHEDEYQLEETIVGMDRLFWLRRKSPVNGRTALRFATVEGRYTYLWFEPEQNQIGRQMSFMLTRRSIDMETPEFYEHIWGVLRLDERPDERFRQELPSPDSSNPR